MLDRQTMRRVSSAPNILTCAGSSKAISFSGSSDKLDKSINHSKVRVHSVQDLASVTTNSLENQLVHYAQSISTNKGVASVFCFEAEIDRKEGPPVQSNNEDISSLASCLATPLMEEGEPTSNESLNRIDETDSNVVFPKSFRRSHRRRIRRWEVPSRIAKRV